MAIYTDKKDGKLTGRYRVEVQVDGHRMRARYGTLDAARKAEAEFTRALKSGGTAGVPLRLDHRAGPKTLGQLLKKASPLLWNGSHHGGNQTARLERLIAWLGDPTLDGTLTTAWIDDAILRLKAEGRGPATINRYLSALSAVLKWGAAKGRDHVKELPTLTWQDEDEGRIRVISLAEEKALVDYLVSEERHSIAAYIMADIDTGCRRAELLTAQPSQVDGRWLRLSGADTKNGYSRSVPLTPRAKRLLDKFLPWNFSDSALRYWFGKARAHLNISDEDFVIHACRHTCATRLVECGVNLRVVMQYMGHRSINTTLRYAHVNDDMLTLAATALAAPKAVKVREEEEGDDALSALVMRYGGR